MRLASALLVAACSLAAPPGCSPSANAPAAVEVTRERARAIAEGAARAAKYDLATYRIVSSERVREGSFQGAWRVMFEHAPPTPPGGHFTVYVRPDGKPELFPGE